jgi:hypothetical protein
MYKSAMAAAHILLRMADADEFAWQTPAFEHNRPANASGVLQPHHHDDEANMEPKKSFRNCWACSLDTRITVNFSPCAVCAAAAART